jgi:hypothetical protein
MRADGDRLDPQGWSWYPSHGRVGERCCVCGGPLRPGLCVLVERVLAGVHVTPKTMHRRCWTRWQNTTAEGLQAHG